MGSGFWKLCFTWLHCTAVMICLNYFVNYFLYIILCCAINWFDLIWHDHIIVTSSPWHTFSVSFLLLIPHGGAWSTAYFMATPMRTAFSCNQKNCAWMVAWECYICENILEESVTSLEDKLSRDFRYLKVNIGCSLMGE